VSTTEQRYDDLGVPVPDYDPEDWDFLSRLSTEEKRKLLAGRLEQLRRAAPQSLAAHSQLVHRTDSGAPMIPARHHAEWVRMFQAGHWSHDDPTHPKRQFIYDDPWLCIVVPPGYGKSTYSSIAYPTWELGRKNGSPRIGIVSGAAGQSSGFAQAIGDAVQSQAFQACYPTVRPDKKRGWGRGKFYVTGCPEGPNPSVLSSGIGGVSVLGKRLDIIMLDDPTTWEDARSRVVMEGQRQFLKTTLISRFPPGLGPPDGIGGRMIVACTRWSEQDLVPTLEELGFKVVRMPALGYWDGVGDPASKDFEPGEEALWPERETKEQLIALRDEDPLVFELVYQGNANILSGDTFDPAWFRREIPPPREEFERVLQFVDTAGGQDRNKGDFFADLTLGRLSRKGETSWWVLDVDRGRYSSVRQEEQIKANFESWKPERVVVENMNEGKAIYTRLLHTTNLPVDKFTPTKDKEFRALPVASRYKGGQVFHALSPSGQPPKWLKAFEMELQAFPNGPHDDQVDALSGAFNRMTRGGVRVRVLG
jgi:predicted phage terminase large subunit-like protein